MGSLANPKVSRASLSSLGMPARMMPGTGWTPWAGGSFLEGTYYQWDQKGTVWVQFLSMFNSFLYQFYTIFYAISIPFSLNVKSTRSKTMFTFRCGNRWKKTSAAAMPLCFCPGWPAWNLFDASLAGPKKASDWKTRTIVKLYSNYKHDHFIIILSLYYHYIIIRHIFLLKDRHFQSAL